MVDIPMNAWFGGDKTVIPNNSSSPGSGSVDLSNYATKDDLEQVADTATQQVIEKLKDKAESLDDVVDFVKTYDDTRTDDDGNWTYLPSKE